MTKIKPNTWVKVKQGATIKLVEGLRPLKDRTYPRIAETVEVARTPTGTGLMRYCDYDKCPDGHILLGRYECTEAENVEKLPMPTLTKDRRALLVKNSEWTLDKDMLMFYGKMVPQVHWPDHMTVQPVTETLPAGSVFKVINPKSHVSYEFEEEKCIDVEFNGEKHVLPIKFLGAMTCTKEGKAKTYWKLLDKHGEPVRTKRYANLGNVKGAVRVIAGTFTQQDVDNEDAPWWIDGSASPGFTIGEGMEEQFDDWVAVEYNTSDKEIQRVELAKWFVKAKMFKGTGFST